MHKAILQILPQQKFKFHFIGNIPDKLKLDNSNIIYHGVLLEKQKIRKIMEGCDILVCPSFSEGLPNVILEGMASGLAVIASDVGAIEGVVSDKTGWLIDAQNVDSLIKALHAALTINDDELMNMKVASNVIIREYFLWDTIIDKTISSITKILNRN